MAREIALIRKIERRNLRKLREAIRKRAVRRLTLQLLKAKEVA